jgi:hypothetical protein
MAHRHVSEAADRNKIQGKSLFGQDEQDRKDAILGSNTESFLER